MSATEISFTGFCPSQSACLSLGFIVILSHIRQRLTAPPMGEPFLLLFRFCRFSVNLIVISAKRPIKCLYNEAQIPKLLTPHSSLFSHPPSSRAMVCRRHDGYERTPLYRGAERSWYDGRLSMEMGPKPSILPFAYSCVSTHTPVLHSAEDKRSLDSVPLVPDPSCKLPHSAARSR